jgi:hypothetical protein
MFGKKLNRLLLALVLLLCLSLPMYSEDVYEITEAELTELENTLKTQEKEIETLKTLTGNQASWLTELRQLTTNQASWLTELQILTDRQLTVLIEQENSILALKESFSEYENAVLKNRIKTAVLFFIAGSVAGFIAAQ